MTYGITNAGGGRSADLGTKTITANDTYLASTDGLDGYSEVTVNVQTAPTLQSKIARQNGMVTADQGYDGLSSVDVGVGQVGETYSCVNLSGASYSANDKIWLNYKPPVASGTASVATYVSDGAYLYNAGFFELDDSYAIAQGFNTYGTIKTYNTATSGTAAELNTYSVNQNYDPRLIVATQSGSIRFQGSYNTRNVINGIQETLNTPALGDDNDCYQSGSKCYAVVGGVTKEGGMSWGYSYNHYFSYKYDGKFYFFCNNVVRYDPATDTWSDLSSGASPNLMGSKYITATSDYRYLFGNSIIDSGAQQAIKYVKGDVPNSLQNVSSLTGSSIASNGGYVGCMYDYLSIVSYNSTSFEMYKYDKVNNTFTDVTNLFTIDVTQLTNFSRFIGPMFASADGKKLAVSWIDTSNGRHVTYYWYTNAESWVIKPYSTINSDSLTGYAAANIAAGATGNVIVGQRVDGTAITATNNSSYDRISGEKVWLLENNGSYQITDVLGLTSHSFTGITKEAIARGASGACEATVGGTLVTRWTRDFTVYGNPTVDDGAEIANFTGRNQGLYHQEATVYTAPTTSVEFMYKFQVDRKRASGTSEANGLQLFGTSQSGNYASDAAISVKTPMQTYDASCTISAQGNSSISTLTVIPSGSINANTWYWVKAIITQTTFATYYSLDGQSWATGPTTTDSNFFAGFANKLVHVIAPANLGNSYGHQAMVDLAQTYVKVDGNIIWQPYAPITE